jgi:hypothetical protein
VEVKRTPTGKPTLARSGEKEERTDKAREVYLTAVYERLIECHSMSCNTQKTWCDVLTTV